jgi:hypothetical protein
MGYMRDEHSGKFVWMDEVLDDSAVQERDSASAPMRVPGETESSAPRPWLLWVLLIAVVAGVGGWGAIGLRRHSESISNIRTRPASYDGRSVVLRGRVGEVFEVGGSCAYYLHQGRDTIIVFSRSRRPLEHETVTVSGSISMGYLDGAARPALFESQNKR